MSKLKDLIEIPERVGAGDYVFTLEEALADAEAVLDEYVVTEQIAGALDGALSFVRSTVEAGESRATYLHGSFGSGKSHFMAVLHMLLSGSPEARARDELQQVIGPHDGWLEGKRFLLVPVHVMNSGAQMLEQAIFDAYVRRARDLHPNAPTPAVYVGGPIRENAETLRGELGDQRFFETLSAATREESGGWGEFGARGWDAVRYDSAVDAGPGDPEYEALLAAIVDTLLPAFRESVRHDVSGGGYVTLAEGLGACSRHAQALGYDAVVLLLDELILWLAIHIADMAFVQREGGKLAALREATRAERPVPIASFVARQRDLRELVGEHAPGAEALAFSDQLGWSQGRFETITLDDRNLPAIAKRRVLRARSEQGRTELEQAFDRTVRNREDVLRTLLGRDASAEEFRRIYPFSPAFLKVLVAASSALQRHRTAIRVMVQLLCERRDELKVGDLIYVGDLFDVLAEGDQPFSVEMKREFDLARELYRTTLLPHLREQHQVAEGWTDALRADDRLVKTLLLAALIPDAEPFRSLTVSGLVALNHGTIASPVAGQERSVALNRLRALQSQLGELRISDDAQDPTVQLILSGVDTEAIVGSARGQFDNLGARRRLVRSLIFSELGIADEQLMTEHSWLWRGTDRTIEVLFENIRTLGADQLQPAGDRWRVIIDMPFDEAGRGPSDDLAKIEELAGELASVRTIFWIPAFFTEKTLADLGTLVTIESLLVGDRLARHTTHLSEIDRAQAKASLENRRSELRARIERAIHQAYRIVTPQEDMVEHDEAIEPFRSLEPSLQPRPPVATGLRDALEGLGEQMLGHQFPGHPNLGERLTRAVARSVWDEVRRAVGEEGGRIEVERRLRPRMAAIAQPLRLGEMHEEAFVLGHHWREELSRLLARDAIEVPTVGQVRTLLDEPEPRGLPLLAADLIILTFAAQTNRRLELRGGPYTAAAPGDLPDDVTLVERALPDADVWEQARDRAHRIFGMTPSSLLSAPNVEALGRNLEERAREDRGAVRELIERLQASVLPGVGLDPGTRRVEVSREAADLLDRLAGSGGDEAVVALGEWELDATPDALGRTIATARELGQVISGANWRLLAWAKKRATAGDETARGIVATLREAADASEFERPLAAALKAAERAVTDLVESEEPSRAEAAATSAVEAGGRPAVADGGRDGVLVEERGIEPARARELLDEAPEGARIDLTIHRP